MTSTNDKDDIKEQSTSSESEDDVPSEDILPVTIDIPTAVVHECDEPRTVTVVFNIIGDNGRILSLHFDDNPSWQHETRWNCDTEPVTYYLQLSEDLCDHVCLLKCTNNDLMTLQSSNLMFIFGHETRVHAIEKAKRFRVVKHTIKKFLKKVDSNVKFIKMTAEVKSRTPTQGAATEHKKTMTPSIESDLGNVGQVPLCTGMDGNSKATNSNVFGTQNTTTRNEGNTFNISNSTVNFGSEWNINDTKNRALSEPSSRDTAVFKDEMKENFGADLEQTKRGSLIFLFKHKSRGEALNMIIKHRQVKDRILHLLSKLDAEVTDIKMQVKLSQSSGRHLSHNFAQMELANLKKRYTAMKREVDRMKGQIDALKEVNRYWFYNGLKYFS
ncbi:uncharacterized protein [Haliotis cracherodii]|uniref:uncharacterized protein n=1 Tax=Haliotis cracherodii TaxID=6455 RepID=UPI0039EC46F3